MIRRKRVKNPRPWPAHWEVAFEVTLGGKLFTAEPCTFFRIKGERGKFRFTRYVCNMKTGKAWVDAIGGDYRITKQGEIDGCYTMRAFRLDRIKYEPKPRKKRAKR